MDEIFKKRESKRSLKSDLIPEKDIYEMLEALQWAPSSSNTQPWRVVVSDGQTLLPALSKGNAAWAYKAPVAFVIAGLPVEGMPPERADNYFFDLGLATENLLLQATLLGYAMEPTGGWKEDEVKKICKIPDQARVLCIVFVGHEGSLDDLDEVSRAKELVPRTRKPLNEIAFRGEWGKSWE